VSDDIIPNDIGDLPARSAAEVGAGLAGAALEAVPIVGGPAAHLFELVLAPSLERRRDEWLRNLGEVVEELRLRIDDFNPRDLENNEQFVSAVLAASTIAVKTHQVEKREMLRNALVNGLLPGAPDEHEQMLFLRFVDELTPLHVAVLAFMADPRRWYVDRGMEQPQFMMGPLSRVLVPAFDDFAEETLATVSQDLDQRRLADAGAAWSAGMSNDGVWAPRIRPLGTQLLAFVSAPLS